MWVQLGVIYNYFLYNVVLYERNAGSKLELRKNESVGRTGKTKLRCISVWILIHKETNHCNCFKKKSYIMFGGKLCMR